MPTTPTNKKSIANIFLLLLLAGTAYLVYLFFEPFIMVIIFSAILASIFYGPYEKLAKLLGERYSAASLIMTILIALVVILPFSYFLFYVSKASIESFSTISQWIEGGSLQRTINTVLDDHLTFIDLSQVNVGQYLLSASERVSDFLFSGGAVVLRGTGEFLTAIVLILFTVFFFFRDGKAFVKRLMYLTPLPNRYDKEIFQKFRDVSYSTMVSTFVTAIAQGIVGAIGFLIVGLPALLPGVAMALLSLLPYIGSAFVWLPVGIYFLATGAVWQGVFILLWGMFVVGLTDNILRPVLIKGKAHVHPLLIFFIFGGIIAFGFWGMIIGPIVIALAFTLLHIYELEYESVLER